MGGGEDGWRRLYHEYGGLVKPSIVFFGEDLPKVRGTSGCSSASPPLTPHLLSLLSSLFLFLFLLSSSPLTHPSHPPPHLLLSVSSS